MKLKNSTNYYYIFFLVKIVYFIKVNVKRWKDKVYRNGLEKDAKRSQQGCATLPLGLRIRLVCHDCRADAGQLKSRLY